MPEDRNLAPAGALLPLAPAGALLLCASAELEEAGKACVFDVMLWRSPARAFALRFEGRVVAYMNRCAHVPTEMDWQPGEFLDADRRFILCSMHGAVYEPTSGQCIAGPCAGERLMAIAVIERGGQVYWYPSPDIGPVVFEEPDPA
jgi:nitrite reductase/ring-hydroxylating ferredoxin subunit